MILKYGSKSNSKQAVRAYRLLMGFGQGDTFTIALRTATRNYQREHGLGVDGIAGPQTLGCLARSLPDVRYMDYSGSVYVRAVQALVSAAIDGKYGKNTRANVVAFQNTAGLEATGDIAVNDWLALFDCEYERTAQTGFAQPVDYKQTDPRWKSVPYTITGSRKQTIGSSGCGPTSMSDIMATWIDPAVTPVEMCDYAIRHGYRTKDNGTAWAFFKSVAGAYGFSKFVQTKSMAAARAALRDGALVVASMGPGYWTSAGHYICLWKCDDTYMYANDPASGTRKKQKLAAFEEQRKQFFIFYRPREAAPQPDKPAASAAQDGEPPAASRAIIDISKWQGAIDFDRLKPAVSLVIARAGVGSDADAQFDIYAQAMNRLNIPFGVYCYSYAADAAKAREEARRMFQRAERYRPLFYVLDAEEAKVTQAAILAFVDELRRLGVRRVGCYVAHNRYTAYGYGAIADRFDFTWIPRYGKNDGTVGGATMPAYPCDLWQYTSTGRIDGIGGNVDMNTITGQGRSLAWFLGGD